MTDTSAINATTIYTNEPRPFCTLLVGHIVKENEHAVLIMDGYPVSPGHPHHP